MRIMYKSPEYLYDVREVKTKDIKSKEWIFKWRKEFAIDGRVLYKLTNADNAIVGMISMEAKQGFVYVHAIERQAKFEGQGVTPYLFTLAALWSDLLGNDAVFSFDAKK